MKRPMQVTVSVIVDAADPNVDDVRHYVETQLRDRKAMARPLVLATEAACPTCSGLSGSRETVGMVCQQCGRDFGAEADQRARIENMLADVAWSAVPVRAVREQTDALVTLLAETWDDGARTRSRTDPAASVRAMNPWREIGARPVVGP